MFSALAARRCFLQQDRWYGNLRGTDYFLAEGHQPVDSAGFFRCRYISEGQIGQLQLSGEVCPMSAPMLIHSRDI
jgi:hypothetical protein